MNERIKDLLNVCGMPNEDLMEIYSDPNQSFYMQQFAELIVKECAGIARHNVMNISTYADAEFVGNQIGKYFGVEE